MPIQFNDDLEVNEITRHSRAILDDLFWEDDEIAEFRHHAFLVSCGLEKDEEDEEDEIVSLEGYELGEEEKSVVTKMHSSLPVIDIEFDILESKQQCLNSQAVVEQDQEKPKPVTQPKIKNRISQRATTNRISKFRDLVDRHRDQNTLVSAANALSTATDKNTAPPSPFRKVYRNGSIEARVEREEDLEIDDSRRNICIQDRLRQWKERDEVARQSLDSSDRPSLDIPPPPPPSKFLETSSPRLQRPGINEKKLRKSTRTPRPAPLDLDNSDQSPIDSPSLSQTPLDGSSQLSSFGDSQRSGLEVAQTDLTDSSQTSQPNASHPVLVSDSQELPPNEAKKERTSRSKSPKPKKEGVGKTKSYDTPRSSKKKLTQEVAMDDAEAPGQTESATSDSLTSSQLSVISMDPLSPPDETPRSKKKRISTKGKKKEKSLSLSSVETASTQSSERTPKSPKSKSPKPSIPNAVLDIPKASRMSLSNKLPPLCSLENDSLHSFQDGDQPSQNTTKKQKKRSSKGIKVGEEEQSSSLMERESSHSTSETTKSPRKSLSKKMPSVRSLQVDSLHSLQDVDQQSQEPTKKETKKSSKITKAGDEEQSSSLMERESSHSTCEPTKSSRKSLTNKLEADSLHSFQDVDQQSQEPTKKEKKRSSKATKVGDEEQSSSLMERESSHSNKEAPKSPKRPSSTSKKTLEPPSPRLSKRTSTTNKVDESEANGEGRSSNKKSSSLKGSKTNEIDGLSFSNHEGLAVDKKSPSTPKKKRASIGHKSEHDNEESPKSRSIQRGSTVPMKRRSLPASLCTTPTVTVTIRKGKKKEEASKMRRKQVRRSLSSCLMDMNSQDFDWRETVKRSNSFKMPKAIS